MYGDTHTWNIKIPPECSWFLRYICKNMDFIKPYLWINSVDPNSISILNDPWCFEVSISFKSTFINMDLIDNNLWIYDFTDNCNWDFDALTVFLSTNFNSPIRTLGQINSKNSNSWVWMPSANNATMISAVYSFLNSNKDMFDNWRG